MAGNREKLHDRVVRALWGGEEKEAGGARAFIVRVLRVFYVAFKEFGEGKLSLYAMSLAFTTLLALGPLLAVAFAVFKAFGLHMESKPFLLAFLEPLGPKGLHLTTKIIEMVEQMNIGVLGVLGVGLLVFLVVSLLQKVESALNTIWKVRSARNPVRRTAGFLSLLVAGAVMVLTFIALAASFTESTAIMDFLSSELYAAMVFAGGKTLPLIFAIASLTFLYLVVPNTRVDVRSAFYGALLAATLWQSMGWVFTGAVAKSAHYSAIYSGFAALIIFMLWIHLTWLIVLVGAEVSFYHQYPLFFPVRFTELHLNNMLREKLAFLIMVSAAERHYSGGRVTLRSLVRSLRFPVDGLQDSLEALVERNLLTEAPGNPPGYVPARDPDSITLAEILRSVRATKDEIARSRELTGTLPEAEDVMDRMEKAIDSAFEGETLGALVRRGGGGDA